MKKTKLILSFAVVLAITMYSCKKEKGVDIPSLESDVSTSQQIMNRINAFKEKMNHDYKSGGNMHIDTAVWDMEALISYENAYPDSSSANFITYETYYTLKVDVDSLAKESDVEDIYDLMLDSVDYHLSLINSSMKFLVFSDVELIQIVDSTAHIKATNGYGFNLVLGWYTPFGSNDDWIWGLGYGGCKDNNSTTSDASNEIQYKLNNPEVSFPGPGTYTDYETVKITVFNCVRYDGIYFMYMESDQYYCMENDECTYRLEGAHSLIYNYNDTSNDENGVIKIQEDEEEGARPDGKDFISIWIEDVIIGGAYQHKYHITYGLPYVASPK